MEPSTSGVPGRKPRFCVVGVTPEWNLPASSMQPSGHETVQLTVVIAYKIKAMFTIQDHRCVTERRARDPVAPGPA